MNGADINIISYVHYWPRSSGDNPELNNTFWNPTNNSINFGDGDGSTLSNFSGALDIVVNELTH